MKKYIAIALLISFLTVSGSFLAFAQETTSTTATTSTTTTELTLGARIRNAIRSILGNRPANTIGSKPTMTKNLGTKNKPTIKPNATLDVACVKAAIAKRDSSIATAWTTKATQLQAAFSLRSTQTQAAWDIATAKERSEALKTAWKTFQDTEKTVNKSFIVSKNDSWKTYKQEIKKCGTKAASYDITTTDEEPLPTTTTILSTAATS